MANHTPRVRISGINSALPSNGSLIIHPTATAANGVPYTDGNGATSILGAAAANALYGSQGTGSAPKGFVLTNTLIDTSGVWNIRNNDDADTLIAATSQPANPQFTYTVVTADVAVSGTNMVDFACIWTFGGKNTDSSTRTINWVFTLNGTNQLASSSVAPTTASPWWAVAVQFPTNVPIAVGDVLGLKLWASVTNVVDYRYNTAYFIPRILGPIVGRDILWAGIINMTSEEANWGMLGPVGTISTVGFTLDVVGLTAQNSNMRNYATRTNELFNQPATANLHIISTPAFPWFGLSLNTLAAFNSASSINTTSKLYALSTASEARRYYNSVAYI